MIEHEPKPVARQWCEHDSNGQKTAWYTESYDVETGWISLSEHHPGSAKVECRDLYTASVVTALQEENERERMALIKHAEVELQKLTDDYAAEVEKRAAAEARANAAEQRVKDAVKVLRPFAEAENHYSNGKHRPPEPDDFPCLGALHVKHLRAARAFIKEDGE